MHNKITQERAQACVALYATDPAAAYAMLSNEETDWVMSDILTSKTDPDGTGARIVWGAITADETGTTRNTLDRATWKVQHRNYILTAIKSQTTTSAEYIKALDAGDVPTMEKEARTGLDWVCIVIYCMHNDMEIPRDGYAGYLADNPNHLNYMTMLNPDFAFSFIE